MRLRANGLLPCQLRRQHGPRRCRVPNKFAVKTSQRQQGAAPLRPHSVEPKQFQKALRPAVHHTRQGGRHTRCGERFQRQVLRQQQIAPSRSHRVGIGRRKFNQDVAARGVSAELGLLATGR